MALNFRTIFFRKHINGVLRTFNTMAPLLPPSPFLLRNKMKCNPPHLSPWLDKFLKFFRNAFCFPFLFASLYFVVKDLAKE